MTLREVITSHRPESIALRRPVIIAEAGVNHEGSLDIARRLVDEAAASGADAIKFQTYKADTIASRHSPAYWDTSKEPTTSQHELFSKYDSFGPAEYEALKVHCDAAGIEFLSTPFDVDSAAFLDPLQDVVKISSSDLTNLPFIDVLCGYGKPILLSTGASDLWEIGLAVDRIRAHGNPFALMHCILNYPTAHADANLGMLLDLRRHFPDGVPGYSDHTVPDPEMSVPITAALLGAAIIEKHFTHDKTLPGNDHYHAMDQADMTELGRRLDETWAVLGSFRKAALPGEAPARANARRSLVAARDIPAGTVLSAADLTWKRPAHGISAGLYDEVLGRTARVDIAADELLQWRLLD
ncbi:MAG: N-acetylneuraminate synthase family protein [Chloroflexota bacterium]